MPTFQLGPTALSADLVRADKRRALRVGPCAIGEQVLFVNSFYIKRMYYVVYSDISRIFKRVAMSKGGYTGKGIFGAMAYLVVQMKDGSEKQCNFRLEEDVDLLLAQMSKEHPEIPVHSKEAEQRLKEAEEKERASYLKELSPEAEESVKALESARALLRVRPGLSEGLSAAAKRKRASDMTSPYYIWLAVVLFVAAIIVTLAGLFLYFFLHVKGAIFMVLGGFVFVLFIASARVLPTKARNKETVQREWDEAVEKMRIYLEEEKDFPLPARYAHPVVCDRMIRAIKKGHAVTVEQSYEYMVNELKSLNKSVEVSQKEYDEVATVKPMFLVSDYQ